MLRILDTYNIGNEICIEGIFISCHFSNKENNYHVYEFSVNRIINSFNVLETSETIKVMGYYELNNLHRILKCRLVGKVTDYKGEMQVEVHSIEVLEPVTNEEIISFLTSNIFKGIDCIMAQKIVEGYYYGMTFEQGFGEGTIDIIKNNPMSLTKIRGISKAKAESIHKSYLKQLSYQNISQFFKSFNISESKIMQVYKHFKGKTLEITKQNAFNLNIIKGFNFEICDAIARKLRQNPFCLERIEVCNLFILQSALGDGHCYLKIGDLVKLTCKKLNQNLTEKQMKRIVDEESMKNSIGELSITEIKNVVFQMINKGTLKCREYNCGLLIYLPEIYNAEVAVKEGIKKLSKETAVNNIEVQEEFFIREFEHKKGFTLEEMQKEALRRAVKCNFLVLTGSAGSGKTTTVEGILYILDKLLGFEKSDIALAAPTGKAAKRLSEVTGYEAKTIHRLLEYTKDGFCKYWKDNPLPYGVVIIDEATMIDIILAKNLLTAIKEGAKVILIGDIEQLPSVGAGKVLNDIIHSSIVPVVRLNVIKRQLEASGIVFNANRIINGDTMTINENQKDFYIIEENNEYEIVNKIIKSIRRLSGNNYSFSLDDIQVICPQKLTVIGTHELNNRIQLVFNPPSLEKREVSKGKLIFRVGDNVIHLNNNYEARHYKLDKDGSYTLLESTGVFNGDIGKIIDIFKSSDNVEEDNGGIRIAVQYDGFVIIYKKYELENIDLAYALTVHKMQGSQCKVAIIPIHMKNKIMLYRNLGYTAITRASDMVCVIGQNTSISYMAKNNVIKERNSTLNYLLKTM